jgi:hypothetical protein
MRALRSILYISVATLQVASAGNLSTSGSVTFDNGSALCSNSGSTIAVLQVTCGNGTTTGLAKSQADFGVLKAYSTFNAVNEMAQTAEVLANAGFTDLLSISYTGAAPTSAKFIFTITGSGFSGSGASMFFSASGGGGLKTATAGAGIYELDAILNAPIIPGDPISMVLTASLKARSYIDNGAVGPWSGTSTADFFSTATLTSVILYDELDNDITNKASITGGAASYPLGGGGGGGAVPEPSTMLLTAGGAGLAIFVRKRVRA